MKTEKILGHLHQMNAAGWLKIALRNDKVAGEFLDCFIVEQDHMNGETVVGVKAKKLSKLLANIVHDELKVKTDIAVRFSADHQYTFEPKYEEETVMRFKGMGEKE